MARNSKHQGKKGKEVAVVRKRSQSNVKASHPGEAKKNKKQKNGGAPRGVSNGYSPTTRMNNTNAAPKGKRSPAAASAAAAANGGASRQKQSKKQAKKTAAANARQTKSLFGALNGGSNDSPARGKNKSKAEFFNSKASPTNGGDRKKSSPKGRQTSTPSKKEKKRAAKEAKKAKKAQKKLNKRAKRGQEAGSFSFLNNNSNRDNRGGKKRTRDSNGSGYNESNGYPDNNNDRFSIPNGLRAMNRFVQRAVRQTIPGTFKRKFGKNSRSILRFPKMSTDVPSMRTVAWHNHRDDHTGMASRNRKDGDANTENNNGIASPSLMKNRYWYTKQVPVSALDGLTREMECFAAYVRLRPEEYKARDALIQHIADEAGKKWPEPLADEVGAHVMCYGSFATPQVCTYQSDVDLTLWGVVPVPSHTRFGDDDDDDDNNNNDNKEDGNNDGTKSNGCGKESSPQKKVTGGAQVNTAKKREERIQKWRDVLEGTDFSGNKMSLPETNALEELDNYQSFRSGDGNGEIQQGDEARDDVDAGADSKGNNDDNEKKVDDNNVVENKTEETGSALATEPLMLFEIDRDGKDEDGDEDENGSDPLSTKGIEAKREQDPERVPDEKPESAKASVEERTVATENSTASDPSTSLRIGSVEIIDLVDDDDDDDVKTETKENVASSEKHDVYTIEDDSDSDDDTADALENMESRTVHPPAKRRRLVKESLENTDDGDGVGDDAAFQEEVDPAIRVHTTKTKSSRSARKESNMSKSVIVKTLRQLSKCLRKSALIQPHSLEVRANAKVPIVNMRTQFGFEADVGIGGHNGSDTSHFAREQVKRFGRSVWQC